nr:cullin-4a [Quercus suber]
MPPLPRVSSATTGPTHSASPQLRASSSAGQKRKRPTASDHQSVASLFAAQHKPQASQRPVSPTIKRSQPETKVTSIHLPAEPATTPLGRGNMYTFTSRSTGDTAVDLTKSSPSTSPQIRRTSGTVGGRSSLNPHVGAKKLVVKNLKTNATWDSKAYFERIWDQLDLALTVIFNDGTDGYNREDLYKGVENVCRQGGASSLYSRFIGRCRNHVEQDLLKDQLLQSDFSDNISGLRAVLAQWNRWKAQMFTIRAIFFFMDRSYLLTSSKSTLAELTPQLFREFVFDNEILKFTIIDGACDLVAVDRQENGMDQDLFRQSIDMFHELATYTASFEPRLCGTTQDYIAAWSDDMIGQKTVPEYVSSSSAFIAREVARCEDYDLDSSTKRELLTILEDHLISRKETDLTEFEPLATMLDSRSFSDLSSLYALLDRRRLGDKLRPSFEKWVDETGTSIVLGQDEDNMVVQLLSLKKRLDAIWRDAFQKDELLGHGLRESFETFMNKTKKGAATHGTDNTKVGEMIAKYVDHLLRGGVKAIPEVLTARRSSSTAATNALLTAAPIEEDNEDAEIDEDAEINNQLDQVLDLFRFVHGKAVFEAFYKKDLARRLLMGRSASADAERSMLARLKTECGSGFTQNLEQMFKDVELAREELSSYKQRLGDRVGFEKGKQVDLSVNILSAAAWPSYPDIAVVVPPNIQYAINDFELHYKSKHSGRKLDWKHALAHCQMRASFSRGVKELVVSSFQAIVLLLFNGRADDEHVSYQHILSETGLRKFSPCAHQSWSY